MFKSIDLTALESDWNKLRAHKAEYLARYDHEGWAGFVEARCTYEPEQVSPGVFLVGDSGFGNFYLSREFEEFPERTLAANDGMEPLKWICAGNHGTYGVCDSVEQFLASDVYKQYHTRPEAFVASLFEVRKADQGEQGWRWHKWGPYIGTHERQCEYLADEEGIESVFCFSISLNKQG